MKTITLGKVTNQKDKKFIDYYKQDEHMSNIAYLICALSETRKNCRDAEVYNLLIDTTYELYDELDAWNEVTDR